MKKSNISRDILSRQERAAKSTHGLGHLGRNLDEKLYTGEKRERRRHSREEMAHLQNPSQRQAMVKASAILVALTAAVLGIAIAFWLVPNFSERSAADAKQKASAESTAPLPDRIRSRFPSPTAEQAIHLVKAAMACRDPEKISSFFRLGGATPTEVIDFLKASEASRGPVKECKWYGSVDSNKLQLDHVLLIYQLTDKPFQRLATLTPDAKGQWQIDFAAFALIMKPTWNELLDSSAKRGVARVSLEVYTYFNGPFGNDQEWICYQVSSQELEEPLRGYCKVGSTTAASIAKIFRDGKKVARATVELQRVEGSEKRQFEITRLVAEDWAVPDEPKN
jgi:hypothetical protein